MINDPSCPSLALKNAQPTPGVTDSDMHEGVRRVIRQIFGQAGANTRS